MTTTYDIASHKLTDAANRIEKANRRLAKAGIEDRFTFTSEVFYKAETFEDGTQSTHEMVRIELSAPAISFGGFTFVARVESLQDGTLVVSTAPEQDLGGFVPTDMKCEHCGINRYRTATFIVRGEDGELHQVGKSCLNLFTGVHVSGLWALEWDMIGEGDDERDSWGFSSAPSVFSPLELVAAALVVSDMGAGFKPSSFYGETTIGKVSDLYFSKPKLEVEKAAQYAAQTEMKSPEVLELAAKIVEFAKSLDGTGDYAVKVRALASQEFIQFKFASTLISVIIGYNKAMERKVEEATKKLTWNNELLGQPKDKLANISATVKGQIRSVESQWGTSYIYNFQTETGQVAKWFSSNKLDLEQGDSVVIVKATVKGADTYNDYTSTLITRATVEKV